MSDMMVVHSGTDEIDAVRRAQTWLEHAKTVAFRRGKEDRYFVYVDMDSVKNYCESVPLPWNSDLDFHLEMASDAWIDFGKKDTGGEFEDLTFDMAVEMGLEKSWFTIKYRDRVYFFHKY